MTTAGPSATQGGAANPNSQDAASSAEAPSTGMKSWLSAHVQVLRKAYENLENNEFRGSALKDFIEVANEMRGHAEGMGYPLAGNVAECLCRLLGETPDAERLPRVLVRQHVDAIRAIVAEDAAGDTNSLASAIVAKLRDVTDDFIAGEAKRANAA
ncbi:MAG: hypothetical protein U1E56_04675 [Bauldia sp.]